MTRQKQGKGKRARLERTDVVWCWRSMDYLNITDIRIAEPTPRMMLDASGTGYVRCRLVLTELPKRKKGKRCGTK